MIQLLHMLAGYWLSSPQFSNSVHIILSDITTVLQAFIIASTATEEEMLQW